MNLKHSSSAPLKEQIYQPLKVKFCTHCKNFKFTSILIVGVHGLDNVCDQNGDRVSTVEARQK